MQKANVTKRILLATRYLSDPHDCRVMTASSVLVAADLRPSRIKD